MGVSQRLEFLSQSGAGSLPALKALSFRTYADFQEASAELGPEFMQRRAREMELGRSGGDPVRYPGHCDLCGLDTEFSCDWAIYYTHDDGSREPVWRERLVCGHCALNPRLRGAMHYLFASCGLNANSACYLTEQTTPLFGLLQPLCKGLVGSEYLQDGTLSGGRNGAGLRHEDVTALSFADESFDIIGTFEVMEHVPDYRAGLREMFRVLKPGGHLLATFPFRADLPQTLVRARLKDGGGIEHLLEPEYHGDPLSRDGVLCFYHFGWDILDELRLAGFRDARCLFYWSWEGGYLGGALPMFHATK
ncbi:class I SAM-dependent methyltransferase [Xinfangfangia sp. CPCC 101601]|uniref:Class I SAM-dependent methyltransferase n=1 Tax=Pseudogemmobacter lacusdianii TaxID=3069608 RepID=A0ABU0VZR1_9RHOB|nr:class I SAM-dependent methyltransferase [Xinfangfangia sp. CPCC 101601]MDQ2067252.1 class I SAM-dependent methyltransferase [Xinfangfangia sp. CPCC 101601]